MARFHSKRPPVFRVQRFRQQEIGRGEIEEGKRRRAEEWNARAEFAEEAADDRADGETDAEGDADQAEILGAVLVIADVGDIGRAGGKAAAAEAGERPADEEHPVSWWRSHR